ncbi:22259_t:CDS:10 [Gigaspora rosea]|nr:22259_t:CDS:10 [Gigaspora rosea]
MLSVASSSLSALPSMRDSFSRSISDSEQSNESQKQSELKSREGKSECSTPSHIDDSNGPPVLESSQVSTSIPFKSEDQQKDDIDVSPSTSWQENLTGTGPPTTNVDTTTITTTSVSPKSSSSLNIEHFDLDEQVSTPIALDIPSAPFSNSFSDITQPSNSSNETNVARRPFKLPASKTSAKTKKKRNSLNGTADSMDDSFADVPLNGNYAPASSKRNAEFHALFRSVPKGDYLINDYGCALQREILVQGRIYVSAHHVCFNANIFGWVTNLVIAFSDIVSIEKKVTAFVIPNAIQISTLHARHFFTSFLSRDTAFELLNVIWKQNHPGFNQNLPFNDSEYTLNKSTEASDASSESSETSEEGKSQGGTHKKFKLPKLSLDRIRHIHSGSSFSSDENKCHKNSRFKNKVRLLPSSPIKRGFEDDALLRGSEEVSETSEPTLHPTSPHTQSRHLVRTNTNKRRRTSTQCLCLRNGQHYENVSLDAIFTGTVEKLYNLIMTSGFVKRFIIEEEKCTDVDIGEWKTQDGKLKRSSSYIKPLNYSIGPKSTKCCIEEECLHKDFDNYVTTLSTTTTPDVPSGTSFGVKSRICIMRAGFNETRIIATCAVEWSKSSWLKGPIEKASVEGQQQYWQSLTREIKKYIAEHPSEFQDEAGSPVRERMEADEVEKDWVKRTQTRSKERTRSFQMPTETNVIEQAEPTPTQRQIAGVWGTIIEVQSILSSILSPIFQNISIPSTNALIMWAILITMIANFYNWFLLQGIVHRLDSIGGNNVPVFGRGHKNELFSETRRQEFASLFDDRIEDEDVLWQWLNEKSKIYEKDYQKN